MRKIAVLMPLLTLGAAPQTIPSPQPQKLSSANPIAPNLPDCQTLEVAAANGRATFHRLGDLPPANAYNAVLRAGPDGCPDPVLVSYDHGSPTGPKPTKRR